MSNCHTFCLLYRSTRRLYNYNWTHNHLLGVVPTRLISQQNTQLITTLNMQDWDNPAGVIDWPWMVKFIWEVWQNAALREDWRSHDELNPQVNRRFNHPNSFMQTWSDLTWFHRTTDPRSIIRWTLTIVEDELWGGEAASGGGRGRRDHLGARGRVPSLLASSTPNWNPYHAGFWSMLCRISRVKWISGCSCRCRIKR